MERNSEQPKTLQEAIRYFSEEQVCIDTVASLRWPLGVPVCPACKHEEHYYLKTQRRWKCKECGKQFSVKLGTIFEDSPISLDKWLVALWMLVNCRNGVSSYEVSRNLGITQKSAWFVLHRLRLAMREGILKKMGGSGSPIEADETFVGGKTKNMHKRRKQALQRAQNASLQGDTRLIGKTVVMGMFDREARKVRATVVPNTKRQTLQAEILKQVEEGSEMHTDESTSYMGLTAKYAHQIVNHLERYVDGKVTTNGIENFWSLLKRGLNGTYVAVEPFHLERYVDEQVFRYNTRKDEQGKKLNDGERFQKALAQIGEKRLTFMELTGKTPQTSARPF